jgi:hypothetical protein
LVSSGQQASSESGEPHGQAPLLKWHGGGFTGVTCESTPDGREGWLNLIVRKGWDSYVSDAIRKLAWLGAASRAAYISR